MQRTKMAAAVSATAAKGDGGTESWGEELLPAVELRRCCVLGHVLQGCLELLHAAAF